MSTSNQASNKARAQPLFRAVTGPRPATEIIQQIRQLIHGQRLRENDRLPPERDLAEQFRVSRNSVRQALRSLEEQGLLVIRKGATGGAFIQRGGAGAVPTLMSDLFSLGAIRPQDLTEVRVLVGVEVVRLACERGSDEDIDRLEENVQAAAAAIEAGDLELRTDINLEFHKMLARMSGNSLLVAITDGIVTITKQFVSRLGRTPTSYVMPFRKRLLKLLRARDAEGAAAEMRRHLLQQQKLYLKAAVNLGANAPD
jgi:GntR family transcriptional repressor for pyruvate dehydrogenase complex